MSQKNLPPLLLLDIDDMLCLNGRYGGYDVIEAVHQQHASAAAAFHEVFAVVDDMFSGPSL